MLILLAARQVVETEDFEEILDSVRNRIDDIESLHRTRELTVSLNDVITFSGPLMRLNFSLRMLIKEIEYGL